MAYAAVISLKHSINERLTNYTVITRSDAYKELKLLAEILVRLDQTKNRRIDVSAINALDAEIREAVCKLEDVLESYVLYHSLPPSHNLRYDEGYPQPLIPPIYEKDVKQEINLFVETVKKLGEEYTKELDKPILPGEEGDTVSPIDDGFSRNKSSTTVGLSGQVDQIVEKLLDLQSGPKNVSFFGMAGIGKTHLAREVFQHPLIVQTFDFIAWVSVGQKHQMKKIFVDILAQVDGRPRDLYMEQDIYALVVLLQNSLHGLRYLIVLDDVWSVHVKEDLLRWLPYNRGRRAFILTTRLEEVACNSGKIILMEKSLDEEAYKTSVLRMRFLNIEESWNLLRQSVFADEYFPRQLEKAGRKIAEICEGLPLLILTVADILRGLDKTEEYWNKVADKKTTTFPDAYDRIWDVLYSSYEFLSQHLKPCFLYMGVFPQSFEIRHAKLVNLWIVEDFLEPDRWYGQTLEDFARKCVEDLVSNSLAIICKQSSMYRIKSFKIHSAYWHLCVKEARKIKFFHALNKLTDATNDDIESQRRLSVQNNILFGIKEAYNAMAATLTTRSLLCTGEDHEYQVPVCFDLVFLKVLDALAIRFYEFPTEVLKLLQLKYLALTHNGELSSSINNLQQLQFLIVRQHHNIKLLRDSACLPQEIHDMQEIKRTKSLRDSTCLPKEIWDIKELRHLQINGKNLPDPSNGAELLKLSKLSMNAYSCTEGVFRSIPHLKKLGISIELRPDAAETLSCFEHIGILDKLESLKCVVVNLGLRSQVVAPPDQLSNLPGSLRKLSLNGLGYSWEHMRAIASLPSLLVLKLRCYAFQGPKWKTKAGKQEDWKTLAGRQWKTEGGEFSSLKFLLLEDIDLVHWETELNSFPKLQTLIIRHCYKLKKIPPQIGDIRTLKMMKVVECSPSVVASANEIYNRNPTLQVVIISSWNRR